MARGLRREPLSHHTTARPRSSLGDARLLATSETSGADTGAERTGRLSTAPLTMVPEPAWCPPRTSAPGLLTEAAPQARWGNDGRETLAALRDTLLPKLISGEVRVKDAERFIGSAF